MRRRQPAICIGCAWRADIYVNITEDFHVSEPLIYYLRSNSLRGKETAPCKTAVTEADPHGLPQCGAGPAAPVLDPRVRNPFGRTEHEPSAPDGSTTLPVRRTLGVECSMKLRIVLTVHEESLDHRLEFQCSRERHIEFPRNKRLCLGIGK